MCKTFQQYLKNKFFFKSEKTREFLHISNIIQVIPTYAIPKIQLNIILCF